MLQFKNLMVAVVAVALLAGSVFASNTYNFDVSHSSIGFSVRHLGLSKVRGNFTDFSGTISYDPQDITKSSVMVTIKTASIDTDNADRDNHLRGADFFNADSNSEITFVSEKIVKTDDGFVAHGTLTMKGVAKKIELPFTLAGPIAGMFGEQRMAVEAATKLNRQDYGITWSKTLDAGGLVVGNEVSISLEIEAVKK